MEGMQVLTEAREVFAAIEEFGKMVADPEFSADYDGHMRTWFRETPHAGRAAARLFSGIEYAAMNPLPGETPEEWGFVLNTFWAFRAATRWFYLLSDK